MTEFLVPCADPCKFGYEQNIIRFGPLRQTNENRQNLPFGCRPAPLQDGLIDVDRSRTNYVVKSKQSVIILCHSKQRCRDFRVIAEACDCVTLETDWYLGYKGEVEAQPSADFLLVELLSVSEESEQSLFELALYLQRNASQILLWTDMGLLESAYAALPIDRSHFLVNASDIDAMPIL